MPKKRRSAVQLVEGGMKEETASAAACSLRPPDRQNREALIFSLYSAEAWMPLNFC